ncbi:MAG: hypothetical protein JXR91_06790 [Deltaproteobacteria bacterium]|nr:hypothetical protein [Deltaproteobacteria bacterium]
MNLSKIISSVIFIISLSISGCGLLVEDFKTGGTDSDTPTETEKGTDSNSDTDTDVSTDSSTDTQGVECLDLICDPNASCVEQKGELNCECNDGYTGDGISCDDIDECETDNGGCEQICINDEGASHCECNTNYILSEDSLGCIPVCNQTGSHIIDHVGGKVKDLIVEGDTAYVLMGPGGLYLFDVSDTSSMKFLGKTELFKAGKSMIKDENYIYVADGIGGFVIVDVSDKSNPFVSGQIQTDGRAVDIVKNGNYVLVVNREGLIVSVDVTTPSSPVIMDTSTTTNGNYTGTLYYGAFDNNKLYVFDNSNALHIYNVTGSNVSWDSQIDTGLWAITDLIIDSGTIFFPGYYGLNTLDISNLSTPAVKLGNFTNILAMEIKNSFAYIVGKSDNYATSSMIIADISTPGSVTELGATDADEAASAVTVSGDTAFVAGGINGLQSVDIAAHNTPSAISNYSLPGDSRDVVVKGDYAFIADYNNGLKIINLLDPDAEAVYLKTESAALNLKIDGDILYLLCNSDIEIIDVSDVTSPVFKSIISNSGKDIEISGSILFVAFGSEHSPNGIYAYDVSDVTSPVLLTGAEQIFPSIGYFGGLYDGYLLTFSSSGLLVMNISNPSAITIAKEYKLSHGTARSIVVNGSTAYISQSVFGHDGNGISVFNLTNPLNPVEEAFIPMSIGPTLLNATDKYLFFNGEGIQALDISDPQNPGPMSVMFNETDRFDTTASVTNMEIKDGVAYIPANNSGLIIMDIKNPIHPALADTYKTHQYIRDMDIRDDTLFVADQSGLEILDVTDGLISAISYFYSSNNLDNITLDGDYAYVGLGWSGLEIYDISDPAAEIIPYTHNDGMYSFNKVAVRNGVAYVVAGNQGLVTYDVTDLSNISFLGDAAMSSSSAFDIKLKGNLAYVLDYEHGLDIYNISNPASPASNGTGYYNRSVIALEISGDYIYVATESGVVKVLDVFSPNSPVAEIPVYAAITDIKISGDYIYIATDNGTHIADISSPLHPIVLATIPVNGAHITANGTNVFVGNSTAGVTSINPNICYELQ